MACVVEFGPGCLAVSLRGTQRSLNSLISTHHHVLRIQTQNESLLCTTAQSIDRESCTIRTFTLLAALLSSSASKCSAPASDYTDDPDDDKQHLISDANRGCTTQRITIWALCVSSLEVFVCWVTTNDKSVLSMEKFILLLDVSSRQPRTSPSTYIYHPTPGDTSAMASIMISPSLQKYDIDLNSKVEQAKLDGTIVWSAFGHKLVCLVCR